MYVGVIFVILNVELVVQHTVPSWAIEDRQQGSNVPYTFVEEPINDNLFDQV